MKDSKVLKGILIFLGLFLIAGGFFRLIDPVTSFGNLGMTLTGDIGQLSEARASGGVLLSFGLLIFIGAFKEKLTYTSTIAAIVLFFGFGIGRILSVILDGIHGNLLLIGMITEFIFGTLALFALIMYRDKS